MQLQAGWRDEIAADRDPAGMGTFGRSQARHATILFLEGSLSVEDCHLWADFILNNPSIEVDDSYGNELGEFLEDWSSHTSIPIDPDSVVVWQARLAID